MNSHISNCNVNGKDLSSKSKDLEVIMTTVKEKNDRDLISSDKCLRISFDLLEKELITKKENENILNEKVSELQLKYQLALLQLSDLQKINDSLQIQCKLSTLQLVDLQKKLIAAADASDIVLITQQLASQRLAEQVEVESNSRISLERYASEQAAITSCEASDTRLSDQKLVK